MTNTTSSIPPKRTSGGRIALIITGSIASLMAVALIGFGALALWGDSQKDDNGYLSTDSHRFAASTHALATDNLDIDLDGAEKLVNTSDFGDIRLEVAPEGDKSMFVGIARTDDVKSYLGNVAHTSVTDLDTDPFEADYRTQSGNGTPAPPADERIWAVSSTGTGTQTLDWDVEEGDWSVVVMNADGSAGVQADVSAGAKLPFLTEIGWSAIGSGALLALIAAGMILFGARPPSNRPGATATSGLAPAAG